MGREIREYETSSTLPIIIPRIKPMYHIAIMDGERLYLAVNRRREDLIADIQSHPDSRNPKHILSRMAKATEKVFIAAEERAAYLPLGSYPHIYEPCGLCVIIAAENTGDKTRTFELSISRRREINSIHHKTFFLFEDKPPKLIEDNLDDPEESWWSLFNHTQKYFSKLPEVNKRMNLTVHETKLLALQLIAFNQNALWFPPLPTEWPDKPLNPTQPHKDPFNQYEARIEALAAL